MASDGGFGNPHPLARVRFERGVSQRELARRTAISRATLHRIESGEVRPHFTTVALIAAALDFDVALLDELLRPEGVVTGS
jgi:transcriptional regulator with XRE-family HTH domain